VANATAYAASKAGLVALIKTLGRELAPEGIIVNGIAPGVTSTPQLEIDARAAGVSVSEIEAVYARIFQRAALLRRMRSRRVLRSWRIGGWGPWWERFCR